MTENTAQADGAFSHLTADLGTFSEEFMKLKRKELEIVMQALNTLMEDSWTLCDECPTTIEYGEVLGQLEAKHDAYLKLLSKCEKANE